MCSFNYKSGVINMEKRVCGVLFALNIVDINSSGKTSVSLLKRVKRLCHGVRIKRVSICCEICGGQGTLTLPHPRSRDSTTAVTAKLIFQVH
jgi:hypothetical protein